MDKVDIDRQEILAVHQRWMDASNALDIEKMRTCFVAGKHLDMWNRNGHPYFGVDELAQLWSQLRHTVTLENTGELTPPRIVIVGDVAWVTYERSRMDIRPVNGDPTRYTVFRGTEIYRRDDGLGNPRWTIWHTHYSDCPPESERRPGF